MMIRIADTHYIAADHVAELLIVEYENQRWVSIITKTGEKHDYQPISHSDPQWPEKALADLLKKIEAAA